MGRVKLRALLAERCPLRRLWLYGAMVALLLAPVGAWAQAAGTWVLTGPMTQGHAGHTLTLLPSDLVLSVGGHGTDSYYASTEIYDPKVGSWDITNSLYIGGHTATLLLTGEVLVAGGDYDETRQTDSSLYDPSTQTWSHTSWMLQYRTNGETATLLPTGKVLVVGGSIYNNPFVLGESEIYDPTGGTFAPAASLITARTGHTATLLPSGKVLIAGGDHLAGR